MEKGFLRRQEWSHLPRKLEKGLITILSNWGNWDPEWEVAAVWCSEANLG